MPGREGEFERVCLPHARSLIRFAIRLTRDSSAAEDLVQETLLLAWRAFPRFREDNPRAWLFRILINCSKAEKRRSRSAPVLVTGEDLRAAAPSDAEWVEVLQAVDRLPDEQSTVLLLAAVEGFTCREIAEILEIPIGTVMSRLSRAREALRGVLAPGRRERAVR